MLDWIALSCLCGGFIILIALAAVDMKTRLLPNEMVLGLATLGLIFHLTTLARFVPPAEIFIGGIAGFGSLYILRAAANRMYRADTLGLGDVKLIGAGGLWLGPDGIMLALAAGATAGIFHGLFEALRIAKETQTKPGFAHLQIPAGPGFAAGLIAAGIYKFWEFNPFL